MRCIDEIFSLLAILNKNNCLELTKIKEDPFLSPLLIINKEISKKDFGLFKVPECYHCYLLLLAYKQFLFLYVQIYFFVFYFFILFFIIIL